jgi:hypothetical protein
MIIARKSNSLEKNQQQKNKMLNPFNILMKLSDE